MPGRAAMTDELTNSSTSSITELGDATVDARDKASAVYSSFPELVELYRSIRQVANETDKAWWQRIQTYSGKQRHKWHVVNFYEKCKAQYNT